jgi:uncharacterized membrane protein SpoIIM required for sporulation
MFNSWRRRTALSLTIISGAIAVPFIVAARVLPSPQAMAAALPVSPRSKPAVTLTRILKRNAAVCILAISGIATGGVSTVLALGGTGFTTSMAIVHLRATYPITNYQLFLLVAPHGALEVLAFAAAGAAGLGGLPLIIAFAAGNRTLALVILRQTLWLAGTSVTLVCVAAVVEAFITPLIAFE